MTSYSATTRGVRVTVRTIYLTDQSDPEQGHTAPNRDRTDQQLCVQLALGV